jgi:3-hydroxymyristoyl/3-hydroxydecanoyl-(acyl carrier protein) dehydratase
VSAPPAVPETAPELIEEVAGAGFRERALRIPEGLGCLDGHFPGFPVVPAVVQLRWVMELGADATGRPLVLRRIEALKFRDLLRPGQLFRLRVTPSPAGDTLDFRLWAGDRLFSSGRLVLAADERRPG